MLPIRDAALHLVAAWMSERYFRTFRVAEEPEPDALEGFDALITQRERRIGVTVGLLWDDAAQPLAGAEELAALMATEVMEDRAIADAGYVIWVPPGAELPLDEPARSQFRVLLAGGLAGLAPGDRREVRLPVTLKLAKLQAEGQYVSVSGPLATQWTSISEGVTGAYHLDARALHRLSREQAEVDIVISRVRDRAALLNPEEVTDVAVHDYWTVSRLPDRAPEGVAVVGAAPAFDPTDGIAVRRQFRREVQRVVEQRNASSADLSVLVMVAPLAHLEDELLTASLRGMNPATYGALDLIVLVGDGGVRQILQPRSLPWEAAPTG
jgi:hypothetical protein